MYKNFAKGAWDMDGLTYAYTYRFDTTPVFVQKEDCVENKADDDFLTVLTEKMYVPDCRIETECAFDGAAAPLFTVARELERDERGVMRFGNYFETVIWHHGVNVWEMEMHDKTVTWHKVLGATFPLEEGVKHHFAMEIKKNQMLIEADDMKFSLYMPQLYEQFHIGITACEGVQRFYNMKITGETK